MLQISGKRNEKKPKKWASFFMQFLLKTGKINKNNSKTNEKRGNEICNINVEFSKK